MAKPQDRPHDPTAEERDERVSIPLDPVEAIKAILKVDPESEPVKTADERADED